MSAPPPFTYLHLLHARNEMERHSSEATKRQQQRERQQTRGDAQRQTARADAQKAADEDDDPEQNRHAEAAAAQPWRELERREVLDAVIAQCALGAERHTAVMQVPVWLGACVVVLTVISELRLLLLQLLLLVVHEHQQLAGRRTRRHCEYERAVVALPARGVRLTQRCCGAIAWEGRTVRTKSCIVLCCHLLLLLSVRPSVGPLVWLVRWLGV